jgi:large subunit ribosomal protein L6
MSRVGKSPINVPAGVDVSVDGGLVTVKGKLGELTQQVSANIEVVIEGAVVTLNRLNEEKQSVAEHGLYRALINNMTLGVSEGFEKKLYYGCSS